MLEILGLSGTTESLYRAMLAHPNWDVTDLSTGTGLSEAMVRAGLDELADLALLRPAQQNATGVRVVSPEVGLAALLAAAEEEAAVKARQIEATRAAIAAISAERADGRKQDNTLRLEGIDAVRVRMEELALSVSVEVMSLNPGGAHRPDAREASNPLNQQILERGVGIRAICRDSFRNDADTLAHARWLTALGGQMRTVATVPMPLVIFDRQIAILPLDPDDSRAGAIEARSSGVVATACALFEHIWSSATPFGQSAAADEHGCSPAERALLQLIAGGLTDEAAARKLGLSLRTVRRMMSDLMERLEAGSRFQAGVNATRRGWL